LKNYYIFILLKFPELALPKEEEFLFPEFLLAAAWQKAEEEF